MTETPSGNPSETPPPAYQPPPSFEPPPAAPASMPPPPPAAGEPAPPSAPPIGDSAAGSPPAYGAPPPAAYGASAPVGYTPAGTGPVGQIRPTGKCILFFIITLGIYGWFWYYNVFSEMKEHRREGLGGGLALVLGIFVSIVMAFLTPAEVGNLYKSRGQQEPVSAMTGFWVLLPFVGGIVWFVKTNGALNDYWQSMGAVAA